MPEASSPEAPASLAAAPGQPELRRPRRESKFAWLDARPVPVELLQHLVPTLSRHAYTGAVVGPEQAPALAGSGLMRVGLLHGEPDLDPEQAASAFDVVLLEERLFDAQAERYRRLCAGLGVLARVVDVESLEKACSYLRSADYLVLDFADETKIPLELVLAHAERHEALVVTRVGSEVEADVVFSVLENGSNGVLFGSMEMDRVIGVGEAVAGRSAAMVQEVATLAVVAVRHVGVGDRACVDTCSYLGLDEGLLVGSFSRGGVLVCSETHPLPYMPTRPFRVNAGAVHSYVLAPGGRTWYLSDLRAGMELLAVRTDGAARKVVVGRVKIERRPLLQIRARSEQGDPIELTVQEDWHVRVFGAEGGPRNVTSLRAGDQLLGYTAQAARHVGLPVSEWIIEH